MCNLKDSPWRVNFTGPLCRCGVPMPGNDEERQIDETKTKERKSKKLIQQKMSLEEYRNRRIEEIIRKNGPLISDLSSKNGNIL